MLSFDKSLVFAKLRIYWKKWIWFFQCKNIEEGVRISAEILSSEGIFENKLACYSPGIGYWEAKGLRITEERINYLKKPNKRKKGQVN